MVLAFTSVSFYSVDLRLYPNQEYWSYFLVYFLFIETCIFPNYINGQFPSWNFNMLLSFSAILLIIFYVSCWYFSVCCKNFSMPWIEFICILLSTVLSSNVWNFHLVPVLVKLSPVLELLCFFDVEVYIFVIWLDHLLGWISFPVCVFSFGFVLEYCNFPAYY